MSHKIAIKEGAFIVSDAHYSPLRGELLDFLEDIWSQKLQASQLILMGDIFDALFGSIEYTYRNNMRVIQLINQIATKMEVIYLEGNHDFNLKRVFSSNVQIFPINKQPLLVQYDKKKIYLAHGDFDGPFFYKLYTYLIRYPFILFILRLIDNISGHKILNFVDKHLSKKSDCNEFINFKQFITNRINKNYKCDFFIEGHFHQNKKVTLDELTYINLAAFACNQRYFIVKSSPDKEFIEENIFSKGI